MPRRTNLNSTEKTLETEDQGKKNPKTNKEAPCGRNPNPEFSDWSERKIKIPDSKAILRQKALKSTCKWSTNFLVQNQKGTDD